MIRRVSCAPPDSRRKTVEYPPTPPRKRGRERAVHVAPHRITARGYGLPYHHRHAAAANRRIRPIDVRQNTRGTCSAAARQARYAREDGVAGQAGGSTKGAAEDAEQASGVPSRTTTTSSGEAGA